MGKLERLREKKTAQQYHTRTLIALVSYFIILSYTRLVSASRPSVSFLIYASRFHHLVHRLVSHLVLRHRHPPPPPHPHHIVSISSRYDIRPTQPANADKNELDKTAHPYRPTPAEQIENTGAGTPPPQHRMTTREHHRRRPRRPRPTRAATRHESDTTRRDRRNKPIGETRHEAKRRHETPTT